ncbi:MAG: high light inducible protein [Cyanobacteriota bacterium]
MAHDVPGQELDSSHPGSAGVAVIDPIHAVPVPPEELNAWRRGFTPQAEIWNGRLAMLGLSVGIVVLLLARLLA